MGNAAARALTNALTCTGFESTVAAMSAKELTVPRGAVLAVCQVQGEPLRYRMDGEDPTAATGAEGQPGEKITIDGQKDMANFRFIRHADSEPGGKLACHYYK